MDMDHDGRRNDRMNARFDRWPQAGRIVRGVNEINSCLGARITSGQSLAQGFGQDWRHDVLRHGVGEPFSRRLDPHYAIALDGRVPTRPLRTERIDAKRSREFEQRAVFTIARSHGRHCANLGATAPNQAAKSLR